MLILKILGFLFLIPGVAMVFGAKELVTKFNLKEKMKIDFEHDMSDQELEQYKFSKATVNFKMLGMLIALPGFILILIAFK